MNPLVFSKRLWFFALALLVGSRRCLLSPLIITTLIFKKHEITLNFRRIHGEKTSHCNSGVL